MAANLNLDNFVEANFDLLADNDSLAEVNLDENITEQQRQYVNDVIDEMQAKENEENCDSSDDFTPEDTTIRHVSADEEKLNFLAGKRHTDKTKEQTRWAVNVMKGLSLKY